MARGLTDLVRSQLENNSQIVYNLLKIDTPSGTKYYTDASHDVSHDGNTYEAQADFLGIGEVEEEAEIIISKVDINLSALGPNAISTFATSGIVNRSVEIRIAFIDPTTYLIVGDPILTFKGKVLSYAVSDARLTATIQLGVASMFANFQKINGRRTNPQSFQREHPNDRSMDFSHELIQDIAWGRKGD